MRKKCQLIDPTGNIVRTFLNKSEAVAYCTANKLCNAGWVRESLRSGCSFYITTKPWNRGKDSYRGFGYKIQYVEGGN